MDIETQKLEIEIKKLNIEEQKYQLEVRKAFWMSISIIVPICAAAASIVYGFYSLREQAKLNFQQEAAKIVMQAPGPIEAMERAKFFQQAFPDRIPPNFFGEVDLGRYNNIATPAQIDFVKMIASRWLNPRQTAELWDIMFARDEWIKDKNLIEFLSKVSATEKSATPALKLK